MPKKISWLGMAPTIIPGTLDPAPEQIESVTLVDHRDDPGSSMDQSLRGHGKPEVIHYQSHTPPPALKQDSFDGSDEGLLQKLKVAMEGIMKEGSIEDVKKILRAGADPNGVFPYKRGLSFTGKPLTFAVKLGNRELVMVLLAARASPDSKYSFKCGAEQVINSVPAAGAAIASKKLSMLRLLHENKADIQGRTMSFNDKPNGTLLYEACYWGCLNIIRYLLKKCMKDIEIAVSHQDDLSVTMTPLHIAAWKGNCEVVEELLKHGALIPQNDGKGRGPPILADAIDMGHVDITRLLVKSGALIFQGDPGTRGVDYVMNTNNMVIIAAVAAGLGASTNQQVAKDMTPRDFVNFLMTNNCEEIFDAIFRPITIWDWRGRKRVELHNAQILEKTVQINFAEGPDHTHLTALFNQRKELDPATQDKIQHSIYDEDPEYKQFMSRLLPRHRKMKRGIRQVPIEACQSVLPDIHNNVGVVWAIANGPNSVAFDHPGAKAMVMYGWRKAKRWYTLNFFLNLLLASIFLLFAVLINEGADPIWRYLSATVAAVLWMWNVLNEVMQMVGLEMLGHLMTYLKDPGNYVDIFRLLLTGFSIIMMIGADDYEINAEELTLQKIGMALVCYFLWSKVLFCQRGFDISGQYMLPILEAVKTIWPFLEVMTWPTIGFVNVYYMLGVYPEFIRSLSFVYRMGYLGDFDLEELEDIDPHFTPTEDDPSTLEVIDPVFTNHHWFFVLFMLATTMFFAIVMMNILIGVLSEQYNAAYSNRHRIFLQTRARIGFEHYAVQMALTRMNCCKRKATGIYTDRTLWGGQAMRSESDSKYLWYCRPKNMEELGLPDEDDDEQVGQADNVHDLLKTVMSDMDKFKNEVLSRMHEGSSSQPPSLSRVDSVLRHRALSGTSGETVAHEDGTGDLLIALSKDLAEFKAEFHERMDRLPVGKEYADD